MNKPRGIVDEALREGEERWRRLVEALPQLVWSATPDGACDYFSAQWTQYTGVAESELLGWRWMDVLHPDDLHNTRQVWTDSVAGRRAYDVEYRVRRHDGVYRWFKTRGVPIRDSKGSIVNWFGSCTDITEAKRTEEALRESEQRWRSLTEALPQLVWSATPDGACDYFSAQWTQYTGVAESELLGWRWMDVLHPDDLHNTRQVWTDSVAGRRAYDVEYRVRRHDGVYRWFKTRGVPIRDSKGSIVNWFGSCTDITEAKRTEEALRESEQRWRSLTESLPHLVWSATPDGSCDYFSSQWTEHTGFEKADLLGWRWLETLHPDDREPTRRFWLESVAGHHSYDIEYRVRRRDGEYRWFKTRGVPIRDTGGNIVKWFGTCTDITELRDSEERFRGTFENAAVGITHNDSAGRFLRVNETYCAIVGYSREELLQKALRDIIHPDELAAFLELYTSCFARGES